MVTAPKPRAWQYMGAGQGYEHDPDTATRVWLDPGDLYIAAEPLTPDDIELAPVQPGRLGGKAEFASGEGAHSPATLGADVSAHASVDRLGGDPILVHCPGSGGEVAFNDRCSYCGDAAGVTGHGMVADHSYDDIQARWRRGDFGRESWLNGHVRVGGSVGGCCAGCGRLLGVSAKWVTSLDIENPPAGDPDWPFEEDDCPVCAGREAIHQLREAREGLGRWQRTSTGRVEHRGPLP